MEVCKKDLRISRDWLGDSWINIKAKPEITTTIFFTPNNSFNTKLSVSPSMDKVADTVGFGNFCHGDPFSKKCDEVAIEDQKNVSCEGFTEDGVSVPDNKPSSEKNTEADNIEIHGCCDEHDKVNSDDDSMKNGDNNNNNGNNKDMKVFETSGSDCEPVEVMEVGV